MELKSIALQIKHDERTQIEKLTIDEHVKKLIEEARKVIPNLTIGNVYSIYFETDIVTLDVNVLLEFTE